MKQWFINLKERIQASFLPVYMQIITTHENHKNNQNHHFNFLCFKLNYKTIQFLKIWKVSSLFMQIVRNCFRSFQGWIQFVKHSHPFRKEWIKMRRIQSRFDSITSNSALQIKEIVTGLSLTRLKTRILVKIKIKWV